MSTLDLADLLPITRRVVGSELAIRDYGLPDFAAARPKTTVFGQAACSTPREKAAVLVQSIAGKPAPVDGNKRLGLAAVIVFYGINGYRLTFDNDAAFDLIMEIAAGSLSTSSRLRTGWQPTANLDSHPRVRRSPPRSLSVKDRWLWAAASQAGPGRPSWPRDSKLASASNRLALRSA